MRNSKTDKPRLKEKESAISREEKPTLKPLADLIKQINGFGQETKAKITTNLDVDNSWNPEPPLAA